MHLKIALKLRLKSWRTEKNFQKIFEKVLTKNESSVIIGYVRLRKKRKLKRNSKKVEKSS